MTYQIKSAELIHALHKNSNKCVLVAGLFSKLTGTLYWVNSDFENMSADWKSFSSNTLYTCQWPVSIKC